MANLHRRKLEKHLYGGNPTGSLQKKGLHNTASVIGKINTASLWRVIAPYVTLSKKLYKLEETEDNAKFSYYLQKRPAVLLHDVSAYISDSVEVSSLFHETAEVLKTVTKAAGVTVYMVDRTNKEIYNSTIVGVDERHKVRWKIEEGTIVAAFVANRNEYVMVDDILTDERFPEGVGYEGNTIPKSVLCVPVVTPEDECFAIIELYRRVFDNPFTKDDLRISIMVTAWMGVTIHQNQERLILKRQHDLNDYLLELVKLYFGDNTVLMEKLMSEVIKFAKQTLGAERGSFFIIDQDNIDEMIAYLFDENDKPQRSRGLKVRFGKDRGIAGLVARTGITMNIKDAYKDSRFNKEIDQKTGYITRSILCMPVIGENGILGVVQVINKKNGGYFTANDERLFKTFSLYCALALHYTNIHNQTTKMVVAHLTMSNMLVHQNNIYLKLVYSQHKPCIHDYKQFVREPKTTIPANFDEFSWYINSTNEYMKAPQYCLYMFLQLINVAEINLRNMIKFILTARKLYRDNPYHNFEHAFNVCHCMYVILKRNVSKFSNLEIKALLISALCHDVDHGGFTNNFLVLVKDDLAELYQKSILENHHYQVTMMMLKDYEVYSNLSKSQTKMLYTEIQHAILATDLALYFERKAQMIKIYNEKNFDWFNDSHRDTIKAIMMTACDLSGQCKPFLIAKRITENLYREFYRQGDLEKQMGLCPLSIMDRDMDFCIPEDQIQFLNVIVIPCVELLRIFLPNTKELHVGALMLRTTWQEVAEARGKKVWRQDDSINRSFNTTE